MLYYYLLIGAVAGAINYVLDREPFKASNLFLTVCVGAIAAPYAVWFLLKRLEG